MDQLRADELKTGHWIKVRSLNGEPWQQIKSAVEVDPGVVCPIYRIRFYESGFDLMADADRVFEVENQRPVEIIDSLTVVRR